MKWHRYTLIYIIVNLSQSKTLFTFKATSLYTDKEGGVGGSQFEKFEKEGLNMALTPAHIRSAVDLKASRLLLHIGSWMSQFFKRGRVLLKRRHFFLSVKRSTEFLLLFSFHQYYKENKKKS